MKHSIALLVENRPGVLTHVSAQISRRGFNIETIAASSTEAPDITRISIVLEVASQEELEQIVAQLEKLIRVVKVGAVNSAVYSAEAIITTDRSTILAVVTNNAIEIPLTDTFATLALHRIA